MSSHVTLVRDESVAVSGEAELNPEVKGIGELLLGVRNARWSIGMSLSGRCRSDSSTARGILNRFEVGKKKQLQLKRVNISRIKPPEAYKSVECRPTTVETTAPDKIWLEEYPRRSRKQSKRRSQAGTKIRPDCKKLVEKRIFNNSSEDT